LNDYGRGALEALAWVQSLMEEMRKDKDWEKLRRDVDDAKEDLLRGIAIDFRFRIERGV